MNGRPVRGRGPRHDADRGLRPDARPGARRARARRRLRVPVLRGVRPARGRRRALPRMRAPPARIARGGRNGATVAPAGRVTAGASAREESPDTAGQDAGEIPGGESRRKVAQKANRLRRFSGDAGGKGEKVGEEPTSAGVTRRLAKPRPVQGKQVPLTRPAEGPGTSLEPP